MNRHDRMEIFRAINNVSKRQNEMEQKLDAVMQMLNAQANEKISLTSGGVEDIAGVVAMHDTAIEDLANAIAESEVK